MKKDKYANRDYKIAYELAKLYNQMDQDCREVSRLDKDRLYGKASKNSNIHYIALELNRRNSKVERL